MPKVALTLRYKQEYFCGGVTHVKTTFVQTDCYLNIAAVKLF
jgi:hypothetical protein